MHDMLDRWLNTRFEKLINQRPAVALIGARKVGKTTLAKLISERENCVYIDLQDPHDSQLLSDPKTYFSDRSKQLIILDEIQRFPELFSILRSVIDTNRWEGRKNKQFLLLGPASVRLLRQTSESLAGRIGYIELYGLNVLEIDSHRQALNSRWLRGGFPESFLADDDEASNLWLQDWVATYLERDIPQLAFPIRATRLRRLWTMLSHSQGETLNFSKLGSSLEIDAKTVSRYVDVLVDLLLVRRLMPWHENTKKRWVKSPRFYVRDSGILHQLLGIFSYDALLSHPVVGKSWEGFVIENIHSVLPRRAETYFYQASTGAEIDLIIRLAYNEIWAVEIKFGSAPKVSKVFNRTCEEIGATRKYVVYGGEKEFSIGGGVVMISLRDLMAQLQDA